MRSASCGLLLALACVISASPPASAATATCASLTSLSLPNTTITAAQSIPAGSFNTPPGCTTGSTGCTTNTGLPSFCRVAGTSRPTSDSDINFEVWIPTDGSWNGKYQQVGNGGFAGAIEYSLLVTALTRGYATASTDDGTSGPPSGAPSLVGHPQRQIDFGYRAIKETTNNAKAIIAAFTGEGPTRSYFVGCSDGGREALMEAQRFPGDFDGIIAGSPANDWVGLFTGHDWDMQATLNGPATGGVPDAYIPASQLPLLSNAALAQCVGKDGGLPTDTFLSDPRQCIFDPGVVECTDGQAPPACLTHAQVEAARKIYFGPHNHHGELLLFPGYEPGGESNPENWPLWISGTSATSPGLQIDFSLWFWCDEVFQNPSCNYLAVNFDSDFVTAVNEVAPIVSSVDPDLSPFKSHGGKLLQYAGWADTAIAPENGLNYYRAAERIMGDVHDFYRVFMVPGMAHCTGGAGPNAFGNFVNGPTIDAEHDILKALERWVEEGVAPRKIIGTAYVNNTPPTVQFQRPLCPYPQRGEYKGSGDPNDASSFKCVDHFDDFDPRNIGPQAAYHPHD